MTIQIPTTRAASPESVARLRERYGELPADYIEFLNVHDGAKPPTNTLAGTGGHVGVRQFVPANEIPSNSDRIEGMPEDLIPIVEAAMGNFVCMGVKDHKIYYWDHELNHDGVMRYVQVLCESFSDFLAGLEPLSLEALGLKLGNPVVWVDPNFKPKF